MFKGRPPITLISAAIFITSAAVIAATGHRESDSEVLGKIKASLNRAPKIQYPTKDMRGRKIQSFDYVIVMPDCLSCSEFRKKSQTFMEANPHLNFMILTPDLKHLEDLARHDNYYVYLFDKKSKYLAIVPGAYKHD